MKALSDTRTSLQIAGLSIVVGMLAEAMTLFWTHPVSFMAFIFLGGALVVGGVLLYLWSIVSAAPKQSD